MTTKDPHSRRLYVSMAMSLDGFIEDKDHALDWFDDQSPQFAQYCDEMIDAVGLAVFGRRSYDMMLAYWPNAEHHSTSPRDQAFARKMNALPKVVLSRTLQHAAWDNTRIINTDAATALSALKREGGKPIVAWGGANLVTALLNMRLVDEIRVLVHPVLLGKGTPLFSGLENRIDLKLVRTTQLGANLSVLCFEPQWT
ncbi:MAG: dihydrofolate reductase family protein [Deltaproteobacteria bacterium]|nr:dihydrofolate reductase family protein [Deltaproteobacteria bacterium]